MSKLTRRTLMLGACAQFAIAPAFAWAPTKPIRMVVAFSAGGSADANARILARQLSAELGVPFVVENKTGAGGNIGAVEVKRAAPDGYTIFFATSAIVLAPAVYSNPGFDPHADFAPLSLTGNMPVTFVVGPSVPSKTLAEFLTWGKTRGDKLTYASSGTGAILHLAAALFLKETGLAATHVPYRGSGPAIYDILGGSVDFMFLPLVEALPHIDSGKLRILAVANETRLPQIPNVQTIREATGLTTLEIGAWQGLMVPSRTPPDIVSKLSAAVENVLKDQETQRLFVQQSTFILGGGEGKFSEFMKSEGVRWAAIARQIGAKSD